MVSGSRRPVRLVWDGMTGQRGGLALAGVIGAVASLSAVALLGTSAWLISRAAEMPPVLELGVAAVLVRLFALSRSILRYVERLVGHDAAFRGLTGLRQFVYGRLVRLAPTGLAAFGRGDLLNRLAADVDAAIDLPVRVVLPWAQAVLVSIATVLFLVFLLPPAAGLVGVVAVLAIVIAPWVVAVASRSAEARLAPARAEMTEAVVRILAAAPDLTVYGAERHAAGEVARRDAALTRIAGRSAASLGLGGGLGIVLQGLAVCGSLAIAIPAVTSGRLEPVWLAVAVLLPFALLEVLSTLPGAALAYARVRGSAERIAEVAGTPPPVLPPESPVEVPEAFGGVVVEHASVAWPGGSDALVDISLAIVPGEKVGVVGPSGAGKSTLAALLLGFLPYRGSVRVSGVEVREADGAALRQQVGYLGQQAHLFDTTIADNVRLGHPGADDDDVAHALDVAQAGGWVDRLPDHADTLVGAFGVAVSGGERQRIALARLVLAQRPFVILDEPTEHLDAPTADALVATLDAALSADAVLVVTHRLADLVDVDRIIVVDGGRIVAVGTHDELRDGGGWYADQWRAEREQRDMAALLPTLPVGRAVPVPG